MPRLSLTLLGGFEAALGPERPVAIPSRKAQALLAFLALPAGRRHARDSLAALLWGEVPDARARTSLRQAFSASRSAWSASS